MGEGGGFRVRILGSTVSSVGCTARGAWVWEGEESPVGILRAGLRVLEVEDKNLHGQWTPVLPSEALLAHDVYVCLERPSGALPPEARNLFSIRNLWPFASPALEALY